MSRPGVTTEVPAGRLATAAQGRGWRFPVVSAAVAVLSTVLLASLHGALDFSIYRAAGARAWQPDLYRFLVVPAHLGFTYPPFAALLYSPAALLPERLGQVVAALISLGALVVVLMCALQACRPDWSRRTVLWWSSALLVPAGLIDPVRESLLLGQVNIVLTALVLADLLLVRTQRRGYLVGLAAAIKLTPLIFVPYFLITGNRRAALRSSGTFVAVSLLSAAVAPRSSWSYWTRYAWSPSRAGSIRWIGNQSLVGSIDRLLHQPMGRTEDFAVGAVVVVFGLWVAARCAQRVSPVLGIIVVFATEALATPVSWTHHYVWVVLLVVWLALGVDRPARGTALAVGSLLFLWAAPFWWVPHGSTVVVAGHGWTVPLANCGCLFLLALVAASCWVAEAGTNTEPRRQLRSTSVTAPELTS